MTTVASVIWTVFFIDHLGYFIMSAVASIWYFATDRKNLGSPVKTAFSWAIVYHLGSIAFGSFFVAMMWVLRQIINAAESSNKNQKDPVKNLAAVLCIACLKCCARMLEELLKYIATHSYIEVVLHNTNFCRGSISFATLIFENLLSAGSLKGITSTVIFFGILTVLSVTCIIGSVLMKFFPAMGLTQF